MTFRLSFGFLLVLLADSTVNVQGQDPCTLCARQEQPNLTPTSVPFPQGNIQCNDLVSQLTELQPVDGEEACEVIQLLAYQGGCCPSPPFQYCSICPDGAAFSRQNVVPVGTANDPTCAQMEVRSISLLPIFDAGTCQDTFLRRSAFYCGCPNTEQQCGLCPNPGDSSPTPRKGDPFASGSNCVGLEYLFSVLTEEECPTISQSYGVDLAGWCGCPGTAPNNTCTLCEEGQVIEDRNMIYTNESDPVQIECGRAEEYAQYIIRDSFCDEFVRIPRERCCVSSAFIIGTSLIALVVSIVPFVMVW